MEPLDCTDPGLLHRPADSSGRQGQVVYGPRPRHIPTSPQVQRTGLQGFRSPQGRLCCTGALQVPSATATAHSRPFIMDFDMSDMEVQLRRSNIILSYQDWFLGSVLRLSEQLQSTTAEHTSAQKILYDLQEFVFSASRAGYDARQHVCHLLFNTVLRRRDAYLSDTFPRLQAPLRKQLRAHILDDPLLFSESTCETAPVTFTQASNVTLLSHAMRASRDSSRSSRPNPRDRQQQQQPQRQLHRPRPPHANVSPSEARTAPSPSLPLRKGGQR